MASLTEKILYLGVDNCLFLVLMRPLRNILGIKYKSSDDEYILVPAVIDEEQYKVKDNYKIALKSIIPMFGKDTYYLSDLSQIIRDGHAGFYSKINDF